MYIYLNRLINPVKAIFFRRYRHKTPSGACSFQQVSLGLQMVNTQGLSAADVGRPQSKALNPFLLITSYRAAPINTGYPKGAGPWQHLCPLSVRFHSFVISDKDDLWRRSWALITHFFFLQVSPKYVQSVYTNITTGVFLFFFWFCYVFFHGVLFYLRSFRTRWPLFDYWRIGRRAEGGHRQQSGRVTYMEIGAPLWRADKRRCTHPELARNSRLTLAWRATSGGVVAFLDNAFQTGQTSAKQASRVW